MLSYEQPADHIKPLEKIFLFFQTRKIINNYLKLNHFYLDPILSFLSHSQLTTNLCEPRSAENSCTNAS